MLAISLVPRYAVRTRCLLLRATFNDRLGELRTAVGTVDRAATQVRQSVPYAQ